MSFLRRSLPKGIPDDPAFAEAAAEFDATLPDWWFVIEDRRSTFCAVVAPNADTDDLHIAELPKPATAADALRAAMRLALEALLAR